jgi:hypothetical protein
MLSSKVSFDTVFVALIALNWLLIAPAFMFGSE